MVDVRALNELTIEAFRKNAIRSVLLVDERFPKHFQVGSGDFSSTDAGVCSELYEEFNRLGLLCDVENDVQRAKAGLTSHMRKSDLLVLDLHLNRNDHQDTTDSVAILRTLADSDQFNLVIVYTADPRLDIVGRQLAGSLRGGVQPVAAGGSLLDELEIKVAELQEPGRDIPALECIDFFLLGGRGSGTALGKLKAEISQNLGAHLKPYLDHIVHRLAEHSLRHDYRTLPQVNQSRMLNAGKLSASNPWFVCGSVFVVVANKKVTPPKDGALLAVLDSALTDWNPGVVRCLLSEIQNCIANSGHPFETLVANDALTQLGWLYHAMQYRDVSDEHRALAVRQLTDRVVGSLRDRIASEPTLVELSKKCLGAIEVKEDPKERVRELCVANGIPTDMKHSFIDVLHALNRFLSSEDFGEDRRYVTTGTILKVPSENAYDWWLCVEPGCDAVPEQAGANRFIRLKMLRLQRISAVLETLKTATHSRFVFVVDNGDRIILDSRDRTTTQHDIFEIFVSRDNQISAENGTRIVRFWRPNTAAISLSLCEGFATPVSQLREANANRLLHEAGHHQSRIAVDFVNCTDSDASALNASKGSRQ